LNEHNGCDKKVNGVFVRFFSCAASLALKGYLQNDSIRS
jgi:hypothetical protein